MPSFRVTRRKVAFVVLAAVIVTSFFTLRAIVHLVRVSKDDQNAIEPIPPGFVDDASRLNQTHVQEVWAVPSDPEEAHEQLAELLARARADNLNVAIAGARHSMGGHTIYPEAVVIDMLPLDHMELDAERNILHVGAGAVWADVIKYLDARGKSVAVMQSNNSFSVGGSISVNCHGWQYDRPPIASTVLAFQIMKADGSTVRCNREQNAELFRLALGGYGLFGVILDVDLRVVPNERYQLKQFIVPIDESLATYRQKIAQQSDVRMAYARLNIMPDRMFDEAIINALYAAPGGELPPLEAPGLVGIRRAIFRGSVDSDYGKKLRWQAETTLQPMLAGKYISRNQLLNESVDVFANRTADTTDILHEYFVPVQHASAFVVLARRIIANNAGDLLNVTVRHVREDDDTFLRYADRDLFAFVMLFSQSRTAAGEEAMQKLSTELIDASLSSGGRYYLPYRLHATPEQFERAYPMSAEFFRLKRKYDPDELFRNRFYEKYGMAIEGA